MTWALRATGIKSCATISVPSLLLLDLSATRFDISTPNVVWYALSGRLVVSIWPEKDCVSPLLAKDAREFVEPT